jgi:hypothetical protein
MERAAIWPDCRMVPASRCAGRDRQGFRGAAPRGVRGCCTKRRLIQRASRG